MSAFYVLTGQVTYRMTYNQSPHIRVRSGIYHFVRRVPADLQQHYRSDRVSISLRTKSARAASRSAVSISQRLDDYWHGLRLQKMDVPALHLVIDDEADVPDNSPTMMEAVETYLRTEGRQADTNLHPCCQAQWQVCGRGIGQQAYHLILIIRCSRPSVTICSAKACHLAV
jgi:hypothetical protein